MQVFNKYQCPLSGGDAVYKARAIMASIYPHQEYDDVLLCDKAGSKRIGETDKSKLKISLEPNPASTILEIGISTPQEMGEATLSMSIYNSIGHRIMTDKMSYNDNKIIDISNYQSGVYFVILKNKHGTILKSEKVIILSQ